MKIEELSLKEELVLCRRAERMCACHFRTLAGRLKDVDPPVAREMLRIASDEESHADALDRLDQKSAWPPIWKLTEPQVDRLMRAHFPSLMTDLHKSEVNADVALRFAEFVEWESSRLYKTLAENAEDIKASALFGRLAKREQSHLDRVREISPSDRQTGIAPR